MKTKRSFSRVLAALLCMQMTFMCISNAGMPVYAAESAEEASSETVSQPIEMEKGTEEKPADIQVQEDVHAEEAASNSSEPEPKSVETSTVGETQMENSGATEETQGENPVAAEETRGENPVAAEETLAPTEPETTAVSGSEEIQTDPSSETEEIKNTDGDNIEELQTVSEEETAQDIEATNEESDSSYESAEVSSEEKEQEDVKATEPEEKWNASPITGEASADGTAIRVSAKEGSFPEGTVLHIDALDKGKADGILQIIGTGTKAIGFDITFISPEGARMQPRDGYVVDMQFLISDSCILADPDETGATLHVYHIGDLGNANRLKSVSAPSQGTLQIDLQATDFSPYLIVKEEAATKRAPSEETRAETVSADLADFLTNVRIDAPQDEDGNYVIGPSSTYEITFTFRENETTQFDNEAVLTYDFPEGLLVSDVGSTSFSITVIDENGTAAVSDNTFEVVNGQLRVRFNQNDPNYTRLTAAANARFDVTISSTFDQTIGEIAFNPSIVKDFVYEDRADLTITKNVVYDMDSDTATYTLQVTSAGTNDHVVIEDHLTGTALTFNKDVTVESNVNGPVSVASDYDAVENGFQVMIPRMSNGEVVTIHYTASVDNTKISGNGTVEQTNNTASVSSDEVPDPKEASADFAGQADFQRIKKQVSGEPVPIGDGLYEQTWTILVNSDHKIWMGGNYIHDWITSDSRPYMLFSGDGITIKVTMEDGSTQIRNVPWDQLYLYENSDGIYGWRYLPPEADGKASYEITCTTLIRVSGALGDLHLRNGAQINNSYDEAETTVGVIGENAFNIRKDAEGTTDRETDWRITVTVPGDGLPEMHVTDDAPKLTYGGQTYIDEFLENSFEVQGLLEGETWRLRISEDGRSCTITFYKTGTQNDANKGLLPTADGGSRDIVIRFKTQVNPDWLDLAAEDGYVSATLYRHRNFAAAWSGTYRTQTVDAAVTPIRSEFEKRFTERTETEIGGVTYPVFRYTLFMSGVSEGDVIHDTFDTQYLRYNEADEPEIKGSISPGSADYNGRGSLTVSETPEGMDIVINSLPRQNNGQLYPYYRIEYSLIVKSQDALSALNAEASQSQNGVMLANTAAWNDISSQEQVSYTYFPYVDKELLARPTADNGYVADFKVMINQYAEDLDPTSDVLTIRDVLSSNLRFLPDSIVITPVSDAITVQHDAETNTVIFDHVPDETTFEITYQARVLGNGNVTYSNTIQFGKFEKTIEEETTVSSSGGGTASNPSITIIKRNAENISTMLAGAVFQLYYLDNAGSRVPVQDKNGQNVTVTTGADGTALIAGNQQQLGWTLWEDRTYCLVELTAPSGYEMNEEPTYFILSEFPSSQMEYDLTGDHLYISNTPEKTSVSVTKRWVGPALEEVVVHLLADEEDTGKTLTLTAAQNWSGIFSNLPKYGEDGNEISYSVQEDRLEHYEPDYSGSATSGYVITNRNTEKVELPVRKIWVGPAAGEVTVELIRRYEADGKVNVESTGLTLVLGDDNNWADSFKNLDKYTPDGTTYVYQVNEINVEGYASEIEYAEDGSCTITNTNNETINIPVAKKWIGTPADAVTILLYADNTLQEEIELTADDNWEHTFENLPKYNHADGHEIAYDVREAAVEGYISGRSGSVSTGFTFTNTITGKVSIPVTKVWIGPVLDSVTIELLADGKKADEAELSEENSWQYTFADLEKYNNGVEIKYEIQELDLAGYSSDIAFAEDGSCTITNTNIETISIPATKQWVGTPADAVTISLYADNTLQEEIELTADDNWEHTFENLPKYNHADGHEIAYDVREAAVEGYISGRSGSVSTGFTFTNTITGKVSIPVTKKWVGAAANKVIVHLLADGKRIDEVELSASNNWNYVFTGLAQYKDGEKIDYTVLEDVPSGYESTITGTAESGYVITNKNVKTTDIPVTKKWVGKEGGSITVRLYADGKELRKATVTKDSQWKYTFSGLPLYDGTDGHKISYTVTEDTLKDYTSGITGSAEDGFVITNTYDKETPETPSTKTPDQKTPGTRTNSTPKTGDDTDLTRYLALMIISGGLLLWLFLRRRKLYGNND